MNFFELTSKRCSYRKDYTSKEISRQELKLIMSAALDAPSGCNMQTTEFVVVTDSELISKIYTICSTGGLKTAQAVILCIIDSDPAEVINGLSFQIEDCSAAVMSMLLAITELGYSSVWVDGKLKNDNIDKKIAKLINLPDNKIIQVLLPVGEAAHEASQPAKKSFEERVCFNEYKL